ncbi:MAG: hypothetical protein A2032_06925 [Chloroflexi bacterium RBG_19FT_COMBO_49_13]|nr:MAG: hypothetical protein A2032_06925 [Chloroflexi bacterium RBG_19FT_COMBO_49_13]
MPGLFSSDHIRLFTDGPYLQTNIPGAEHHLHRHAVSGVIELPPGSLLPGRTCILGIRGLKQQKTEKLIGNNRIVNFDFIAGIPEVCSGNCRNTGSKVRPC